MIDFKRHTMVYSFGRPTWLTSRAPDSHSDPDSSQCESGIFMISYGVMQPDSCQMSGFCFAPQTIIWKYTICVDLQRCGFMKIKSCII